MVKPAILPKPERWDHTHGTYIAGRAYIDGVDTLAIEMEERWGADRLRLLVPPELREKFDRQRYLTRAAIQEGTLEDVRRECQRMTLALQTLDRAAQAAGAEPLPASVIECAMADGTVLAIVPDAERGAQVIASGRRVAIYSIEEIARLLEGKTLLTKVKITWPGAEVTKIHRHVRDPLEAIDNPTGFDTSLNDGAFA